MKNELDFKTYRIGNGSPQEKSAEKLSLIFVVLWKEIAIMNPEIEIVYPGYI
jgi:hypothetical protein